MPELLRLFLVFAKIGVTTIGGGMAMLAPMMREFVIRREWLTAEEFADITAVGQCTPGIIAVNIATFVGSKRAGVVGGVVSTLGIILPSVVIITIIAAFLENFVHISWVSHAFAGVRVAVGALLIKVIVGLWKTSVSDITAGVIFAVVFLLVTILGVHPALLAILAAVSGIIIMRIRRRRAK